MIFIIKFKKKNHKLYKFKKNNLTKFIIHTFIHDIKYLLQLLNTIV